MSQTILTNQIDSVDRKQKIRENKLIELDTKDREIKRMNEKERWIKKEI